MTRKSASPLPENPFEDAPYRQAYAHCIALEKKPDARGKALTSQIAARFLGHLLRQLHITEGLGGAEELAVYINIEAIKGNDALKDLAQQYITALIKTFKSATGPTPQPSFHSSKDEDQREEYLAIMKAGTLDHRTAKKFALRRDKYRCVVTGIPDHTSANDDLVDPADGEHTEPTQAAHIIPERLNNNINPGTAKRHNTAGFWTVLGCFLQDQDLPKTLQGRNTHRLDNIMTLTPGIHTMFDSLELWFKPVQPPVPHTYQTYGRLRYTHGTNRIVTFAHTKELPAPNAKFLALHALTCEVAHMSGAAEYVEEIDRDVEENHVLAQDGSSAQLLASALALVTPVQ